MINEKIERLREILATDETEYLTNAIRYMVGLTVNTPPELVGALCADAINYPPRFRVSVLRSANIYRNTPEVFLAWWRLNNSAYQDLKHDPKVDRIMVGIRKDGRPNSQYEFKGKPLDALWRNLARSGYRIHVTQFPKAPSPKGYPAIPD